MLRADLKAAGIQPVVGARVVDLHALRVTFITHLALGGVPLAVTQKLARHSDPWLTSNVYTSLGLADLHRPAEACRRQAQPPPVRRRPSEVGRPLACRPLVADRTRNGSRWLFVSRFRRAVGPLRNFGEARLSRGSAGLTMGWTVSGVFARLVPALVFKTNCRTPVPSR
jgi:hypothetical protein